MSELDLTKAFEAVNDLVTGAGYAPEFLGSEAEFEEASREVVHGLLPHILRALMTASYSDTRLDNTTYLWLSEFHRAVSE